jgi:Glu-tRNAGln amidotransferase C subunit
MITTLQSQLQFVRALQTVNTAGIEPLTAIRDETMLGVDENTITLETLRPALESETLVGHYKRPRRLREAAADPERGEDGRVEAERWEVLGMASKRAGKFFVVQSKEDS